MWEDRPRLPRRGSEQPWDLRVGKSDFRVGRRSSSRHTASTSARKFSPDCLTMAAVITMAAGFRGAPCHHYGSCPQGQDHPAPCHAPQRRWTLRSGFLCSCRRQKRLQIGSRQPTYSQHVSPISSEVQGEWGGAPGSEQSRSCSSGAGARIICRCSRQRHGALVTTCRRQLRRTTLVRPRGPGDEGLQGPHTYPRCDRGGRYGPHQYHDGGPTRTSR